MNLLLKNYEHNSTLTLKEFLYSFLTDLNYKHDTIYEYGDIQTVRGKHRSLGDITNIVNSYYPLTSRREVKETLLSFGSKLVGHYCGNISKRVYLHRDTYPHFEQCADKNDEYGDPITYLTDEEN